MRVQSNSGFSLIEVTVGMALVAGMALTVSTMIQWQSKASRGIASILDRNDVNMRLSTWAGDSAMCLKMFGATPYRFIPAQNPAEVSSPQSLNQVFDGASGLSKFLKADHSHLTYDPNLAVYIDYITIESEDGLPPASGGGKLSYKSLLRIQMTKRQPGLKFQANGKENINVGGDRLKDVVVPVVLQVDSATQLLISCSASGSSVIPDCSASGDGFAAVFDSASGKTVCKKVSCGSGKFPAGTNSDGSMACCNIGDHYSGLLNGVAKCCPTGQFLKNGACAPAADAVCGRGEQSRAVSDSSVTCCHEVNFTDERSKYGNKNYTEAYCPMPDYYIVDGRAGCTGDHNLQYIRSNSNSGKNLPNKNVNGQNRVLNASCAEDGISIDANCCREVIPTFPSTADDPGTGSAWQYWNGTTYVDDSSKCSANSLVWDCAARCIVPQNCAALGTSPRYSSDGCGGCQPVGHGGGALCVAPQVDDGYGNCI